MVNLVDTTATGGRANFLERVPRAVRTAWAVLTEAEASTQGRAWNIAEGQFDGKRALVLGSGVGGLTTAYELLRQKSGMKVTVLEAKDRTGGRCLSLRTGDALTEDKNSDIYGPQEPGETQTVRFDHPRGDEEPYLNAGPGRIPSSHKRLLSYLKEFQVEIEVYVMNSQSNLVQMDGGPFGDKPVVYRRLDHSTRGWIAEYLYGKAEEVLEEKGCADVEESAKRLRSLLVSFGDLTKDGEYDPKPGGNGQENATSDRGGFTRLPGVDAGETAAKIDFEKVLTSEFWKKTRFYQPEDFLWQPTSFQPVGGMDQVQRAFVKQVAALGGDVLLNHPVKAIDWDDATSEFVVHVQKIGTSACDEFRADYIFSNMAMPFLEAILSKKVTAKFDDCFSQGLAAVYKAQREGKPSDENPAFLERFLAKTTKVGWQADRVLWQGSRIQKWHYGREHNDVPEHEIGVVPIYGGISWTSHDIGQIWYPSSGYQDEKGVLTGCYNFSETASKWGTWTVEERLCEARKGAAQLTGSPAFAAGLDKGVAIAWQNVPHIKGGWAQWHTVDDGVCHFNNIAQGTAVAGNCTKDPVFFVVGDQTSSLPGWQEGAVASALNAITRVSHPRLKVPHLACLPDTRLMVEGV